MGYGFEVADSWVVLAGVGLTLLVITLVGAAVAICGWGGARAGMLASAMVGLLGVLCLNLILMTAYWLWWVSIPAIYAGWVGFGVWRTRAGTVRRQPLRFNLSAMFLFVLVVAVLFGGFTLQLRQQHFEDELTAQLRRHTGSSIYQVVFGRPTEVIIAPADEAELREIVDILRQYSNLRTVQLNSGSALPPAQTVELLSELTGLQSLRLQHLPVSDADLIPLAKLQRLEQLELEASSLSDAGLPNLYPLKRLRLLWLYHQDTTRITPQGLDDLHDALPRWAN
jgi:hypothetical protein